ncbi:hypothetical protein [Flavobacterium sp.]|uniref:hypothetical protein n=1 Tax=Flavobacterium sp. TaxID=239 RepID=UPI00248A18CF|nr:hypothetical protein [Flavobacterium sp.]MDI1316505.1 hypothetical protein [Flavobacterium sp.]
MFTLFKKRDFSDYVSDTFQFFRVTGKHYLKSYFTICGIMLLLLVVFSYFLFQVYFDFFLNFGKTNNNADFFQNYVQNNIPIVIGGAVLMFLFIVFLSMLNYSIPVIYMELYAKNKGNTFETKDILAKFKTNFGRILVFFLGLIFLVTPLLMLVFVILILLCFILIGIPLLLFAVPTAVSWITLSFFEYLNHDKGFFESLGSGFKHVKNQYFPNVGSLIIMYIIIQIGMSVFTIIPYMFGMVSIITSTQNQTATNDSVSTVKIMLTIVMVVSIVMSYILNNLLFVNQGLVYYSRREFDENISSQDSIDLIGSE